MWVGLAQPFVGSLVDNAASDKVPVIVDLSADHRFVCGVPEVSGANAGKELILTKALTTIGQPGVQVAAITRRPQGFFLIHVDGGPSNSVAKVGGSPMGSSAHELKSHDIIEVAGVKMEFYLK